MVDFTSTLLQVWKRGLHRNIWPLATSDASLIRGVTMPGTLWHATNAPFAGLEAYIRLHTSTIMFNGWQATTRLVIITDPHHRRQSNFAQHSMLAAHWLHALKTESPPCTMPRRQHNLRHNKQYPTTAFHNPSSSYSCTGNTRAMDKASCSLCQRFTSLPSYPVYIAVHTTAASAVLMLCSTAMTPSLTPCAWRLDLTQQVKGLLAQDNFQFETCKRNRGKSHGPCYTQTATATLTSSW
jgi:hypothetical protein